MYSQANLYQSYHQSGVMTASPMDLVIMLYDAAIKNLKLAQMHLEGHNNEKAHQALSKEQSILLELIHSLDLKYDVSQELLKLYEYMLHETEQINIHKDPTNIAALVQMLEELRDAWKTIKASSGPMYKAAQQE